MGAMGIVVPGAEDNANGTNNAGNTNSANKSTGGKKGNNGTNKSANGGKGGDATKEEEKKGLGSLAAELEEIKKKFPKCKRLCDKQDRWKDPQAKMQFQEIIEQYPHLKAFI